MDRELDARDRYRRLGRRAAVGLGALGLCVAVLILLPGWLRPSVAREQIRTGTVDRGPVEGIVEASGTVCVEFGSCDSLPSLGPGPSTPFATTPGPAIAAQVMSMFGE